MGNQGGKSISAGNKAQANTDACEWYKLLNLHGEGEFVELIRKATNTRDYTELDRAIYENIKPFLYNNGEGRYIPTSELVHVRRCYRDGKPITPPTGNGFNYAKSTVKPSKMQISKPPSPLNFTRAPNKKVMPANPIDLEKRRAKNVKKKNFANLSGESMRFVCWNIYQRGTVGETMMHACFLKGLRLYSDLAKRLQHIFPKLIVDTYISDQYYGESVLHMAVVNEDPAMVKYLLDSDEWNLHNTRCVGSFFSTDDQKHPRTDLPDSELVEVKPNTNYKGLVYWGEYPVSFAVCLGQEECVRLLVARGAKVNGQDVNGNTALHMAVVWDQKDMFDLVFGLGASLAVHNSRGLTPLTLAAELGKKEMYDHILAKEMKIQWIYGKAVAYQCPLIDVDSINAEGEINTRSALHLIIHGKEPGHLDMVDGTILTLLQQKWKNYYQKYTLWRFILFSLYYTIYFGLVVVPNSPYYKVDNTTEIFNATLNMMVNVTSKDDVMFDCYMLSPKPDQGYDYNIILRYICEILVILANLINIMFAFLEWKRHGWKIFSESLISAPTKTMYLLSSFINMAIIPGRFTCESGYEGTLFTFSVLLTFPYFLFFCRSLSSIGPFILMIYKMIAGDLVLFLIIYFILTIGLSQAMYLCFIGYVGETRFDKPFDSIMGMIYITLGQFSKIYEACNETRHVTLAKFFVLLHSILSLLLINMFIAMMGNTYQLVNDTEKEYLRQWAHVILTIEHSLDKETRFRLMRSYSQPMSHGSSRALAVKTIQSEEEKLELTDRKRAMKAEMKEAFIKHRRQQVKSTLDFHKQPLKPISDGGEVDNLIKSIDEPPTQRKPFLF